MTLFYKAAFMPEIKKEMETQETCWPRKIMGFQIKRTELCFHLPFSKLFVNLTAFSGLKNAKAAENGFMLLF